MKKVVLLLWSLCSINSVQAEVPKAPVGVRPCCAFGMDLKAQVGAIPVPFFSLENVLGDEDIGAHHYNDGGESVAGSLFGFADEKNGILYTRLGGFIDTAHVRDTADYTFYLYKLNQQNLGENVQVTLPAELRVRQIRWIEHPTDFYSKERNERSAKAAAFTAFRLAQWHEIAQWFGMVSVSGFKEYASAFSSEDLYSNMLGALIAQHILLEHPSVTKREFQHMMDLRFHSALNKLDVQPKAIARQKMQQLDGQWWDSSRRLPDKWVVLFRDYHLALSLLPHAPGASMTLSLEPEFADEQPIEDWVRLELIADKKEGAFAELPQSLKSEAVWQSHHFQTLADFARMSDEKTHPQR